MKALRVTVRRGCILEDTLVALRSGFDEKKHFRVRFLGEPAVDAGGPRREYFMLLMGAIGNNSALVDGPPNRRVLRHNASAFQVTPTCSHTLNGIMRGCTVCAHTLHNSVCFAQDELFMYVGRMCALSILHGGPGPVFLAPVIVDYLFGGISQVKPDIDDVPDEQLQSKIRKVCCCHLPL